MGLGGGEKCHVCEKRVYFAELVRSFDNVYHKACFRCGICDKRLNTGENLSREDQAYCKNCYQKNFGPHGFRGGVTGGLMGIRLTKSQSTLRRVKKDKIEVLSQTPLPPKLEDSFEETEKAEKVHRSSFLDLGDTTEERAEKTKQIVDLNNLYKYNFLDALEYVKANFPNNRCAKYMTKELFLSYDVANQDILYKCAITGIENPDSGLGCYAMTPADYETFSNFFDPLIRDYHNASAHAQHVTDWDISDVGDNGVLDVADLGLDELSMRVRVGRNLEQYNLPGNMDIEERIDFEKTMLKAFDKLIENEEYGGQVYSLTPDFGDGEENPNLISDEEYGELVDAHIMFKNMDDDPYLKSAGIAGDWPYGRGCYVSADKQFIIWFGEEDQLRIMCMKKGTKLNEVFDRLRDGLDMVESIEGIKFATSTKYGYVTSCPSNLGTGMRASVHIKLPNLTSDGTDTRAKQVAKPLGLSVRGTGGEHTPVGADGTVDISPSARLFIREKDIIKALYDGIQLLMEEENKV